MSISIVLDTNVLVAALRSRRGASFRLLSLIGSPAIELNLSVPLVFEHEDTLKRNLGVLGLQAGDIDDVLDYLCSVGHHRMIYFLWRPTLRNPKDDMVLELAVEAACDYLVTFNLKDFADAARFGVRVTTPRQLLAHLGALP